MIPLRSPTPPAIPDSSVASAPLTPAQVDAIRLCLARHRGLSAASIVWALVPELRAFCEGLTGDSIGNFPWDPDDYSRCRRVLALIPSGADRLGEVATAFPAPQWKALAACWAELEALWLEEENNASGNAPKLYARMCSAITPNRKTGAR